jgi:hypothetical protein
MGYSCGICGSSRAEDFQLIKVPDDQDLLNDLDRVAARLDGQAWRKGHYVCSGHWLKAKKGKSRPKSGLKPAEAWRDRVHGFDWVCPGRGYIARSTGSSADPGSRDQRARRRSKRPLEPVDHPDTSSSESGADDGIPGLRVGGRDRRPELLPVPKVTRATTPAELLEIIALLEKNNTALQQRTKDYEDLLFEDEVRWNGRAIPSFPGSPSATVIL